MKGSTMTPETKAAIKKLMASRKREINTVNRAFPKTPMHLSCTMAYVQAYYQMNNLLPLSLVSGVRDLFEPLNTAPTTWPEPDVEPESEVS